MISKILCALWLSAALAFAGATLTQSTTSAVFEPLTEGYYYQVTAGGTWDGASLTVEIYNHLLSAYVPATSPLLNSAANTKEVFASGQKMRVTVTSATSNTSLAVEYLKIAPPQKYSVTQAFKDEVAGKQGAIAFPLVRPRQPISLTNGPHEANALWTAAATSEMTRISKKSPPWGARSFILKFPAWLPSYPTSSILEGPRIVVRSAIEYPSGVFHPVTFNGRRDIVIESPGLAISDPCEFQIPPNTQYWVRTFVACQTGDFGTLRPNNYISNNGGGFMVGTPGAAATATLTQFGGVITAVTLTSNGSGYTPNSEISCTISGAGTGASIYALTGESGVVDTFRIASGGTGYTGTPTIAISGNATGTNEYGGLPVDMTTRGTIANQASNWSLYGPSAILAIPADTAAHRSYAVIGDSISNGLAENNSQVFGWVKRVHDSTGIPMQNLSLGGSSLYQSYNSGKTIWTHLSLAEGCTDVIIALGTNDVYSGQSLVQIQANMTALVGELQARGMRVHLATPPPMTNGTNTAVLSTEGVRIAFADWERTLPLGVATCFDTADALETSRNSGFWKTGAYSGDGIHPTTAGHVLMAGAFSSITP